MKPGPRLPESAVEGLASAVPQCVVPFRGRSERENRDEVQGLLNKNIHFFGALKEPVFIMLSFDHCCVNPEGGAPHRRDLVGGAGGAAGGGAHDSMIAGFLTLRSSWSPFVFRTFRH